MWIPCFPDACYPECRKNHFKIYVPLIFFHSIHAFFFHPFQNSRPIFCHPDCNILIQFHPSAPRPPPPPPYDLVITFHRCQKLHRSSRLWSAWIPCNGWIFFYLSVVFIQILDAFANLSKVTISFTISVSVRPPVHVERLGSTWTDLRNIWVFFLNLSRKFNSD